MPESQSGVDAKSIIKILKRYNEPVPIDFVAASLSSSSSQMRMKMADLQKIKLVKISDDKVSLNLDE
jgi:hypothetical protein